MDRAGLFVDAGYLLSEGAKLILGTGKRSEIEVKVGALANSLMELVQEESDLPLLRTYWYDGCWSNRLTTEHENVREVPLVKLRLGKMTPSGQKGVDSLIFRDLTTLARERAIATAYLVAGDEDLREAVTMAQDLGVQVTLVTVIPADRLNTSEALVNEADLVVDLEASWLAPHFKLREDAKPAD
ncbi:NYN domain-containing protein [Modestobacter marinus]|uniref:NYN domain-containing protein n=1 Tax=Modestobacter marinus TaxID=477641 RepID=A0ABQ2GBS9_9ACTN|nr:NYN domain-containing protein [Modestobacter marinus]GGL85485.1 hypothetical protein GCM10011589_47360 [Modestobacter marinus]